MQKMHRRVPLGKAEPWKTGNKKRKRLGKASHGRKEKKKSKALRRVCFGKGEPSKIGNKKRKGLGRAAHGRKEKKVDGKKKTKTLRRVPLGKKEASKIGNKKKTLGRNPLAARPPTKIGRETGRVRDGKKNKKVPWKKIRRSVSRKSKSRTKTDPSPRAEPPEAKPEPSPRAKPPEAKPMPKKQVEKDDGRSATPKRQELMKIMNGLDHCLTVDGAEGMRSLAEKPSAQLCFYAHNENITACTRLAITIGYMTSNARPKERHLCLRCAARKISEGNIDVYMDTDYDLSEPSHVATLEQQHSVVDMLEGCAAATPVVAPPPPPAAAPTVVAPLPPAAAPTLVAPPPPPRDIVDMQEVD